MRVIINGKDAVKKYMNYSDDNYIPELIYLECDQITIKTELDSIETILTIRFVSYAKKITSVLKTSIPSRFKYSIMHYITDCMKKGFLEINEDILNGDIPN